MHFLAQKRNANPRIFFLCFPGQFVQQIKVQRPFNFIVIKCVNLRELNIIWNLQFLYSKMKRYNIEDINILMITFIIEISNIGPTLRTLMEQLNANLAANYHNYSFSDGTIILSIGEFNRSKTWNHSCSIPKICVNPSPRPRNNLALHSCVASLFP